ncbi:MAG: alpha,alpha-trehalase TreA [Chitinophagaceae bacterium]|nr:alpha,alpha-trehalase TreA [Chitinophagaceae bacterium]
MKGFVSFMSLFFFFHSSAQKIKTPDQVYGQLFRDVQESRIFPDGKTFVDAVPKKNPAIIVADYLKAVNNPSLRFSLKWFVEENFFLPPPSADTKPEKTTDIVSHIQNLWKLLKRQKDKPVSGSSLLPLPFPYIVPGGRFREIYYWDSYFTMLGLKESGEKELMHHMLENFKYLIETYGHVPNGNRSYYLSRSQPPFFSLMVSLYAETEGPHVLKRYIPAVEKEYRYWMKGFEKMKAGQAAGKTVRMPDGLLLNRYSDALNIPRQESWADDIETAAKSNRKKEVVYHHLRSAAESGWDFSSRWLADNRNLHTIETADIIPVDLNCLLYYTENLLAGYYAQNGSKDKSAYYQSAAHNRLKAIQKYCYDAAEKIYYDYHFSEKRQTAKFTLASFFPLWLLPSHPHPETVEMHVQKLKKELLAPHGVLTTSVHSGQQWDAPNGWAPLQWVVIQALEKNDRHELATLIARRWIQLNLKVFERTGKLMEKYNVTDDSLEAGGGEYPGQDGFGWTNGVLLALIKKYGKN